MRFLLLPLLLTGCLLDPCEPVEVRRVVNSKGTPVGYDHLLEWGGTCQLTDVRPYDPWFSFGLAAYVETWDCGCG